MAKYIDADHLRKRIENLKIKVCGSKATESDITAALASLDLVIRLIDSIPDEPITENRQFPNSSEMIAEWENNELPMLREKDFHGDAERMAYNAFLDGFATGLKYKR